MKSLPRKNQSSSGQWRPIGVCCEERNEIRKIKIRIYISKQLTSQWNQVMEFLYDLIR